LLKYDDSHVKSIKKTIFHEKTIINSANFTLAASRKVQFFCIRRNSSFTATGTDLLRPSTCPSVVRVDGAFRTPASLEGAGVRLAWFPVNSIALRFICA
jgi:hypothetical protein